MAVVVTDSSLVATRLPEISVGYSAYFLVGPTGVGKTEIAHQIASAEGFQVLSADSMAVYRDMNIGTAKPSAGLCKEVQYHGLDLVTPDALFNVALYRNHALKVLRAANGRIIVAGGTGLYIKSLIHGLEALPEGNGNTRKHWEAVYRENGVIALQDALRKRAPEEYKRLSDPQNARRLIRAIEIAENGRKRKRTWNEAGSRGPIVALDRPQKALAVRIEERVRKMYDAGLVREVRMLRERYTALSPTARQAIGYAEAGEYLDGLCGIEEAIEKTIVRTRQLAKRQRTWFRHQQSVHWIDMERAGGVKEVIREIMDFWGEYGPTEIAE